MAIIGIPSTRVSDQFIRQRLMDQVQSDQVEIFRLQTQLTTGRRFELPSEDSVATQRVMSLQLLIERKVQVQSNLSTNQSYLNSTDTALSEISNLMAETRGTVISVFGTTASDTQRRAAAQQVEQAVLQLMDSGNQMFRGRYLFAGSQTTTVPFATESNAVRYDGNEQRLSSFANLGLLFDTNLQGNEAFGSISEPVRGGVDLNPVVTRWTRLADLRGGRGITRGSISISDGATTKIIDLSGAETVGDLATLVHANPPDGKTVDVDITPTGLILRLDSGSLSIKEVGGGTTAAELGILRREPVGTTPVASSDLDPRLAPTTRLGNVLGARAMAVLRPAGGDNDIIFQADHRGDDVNGVTISLVDDGSVHAGGETASYDPVAKTLVVRIEDSYTTALDVVNAVNSAHDAALAGGPPQPFTADLDFLDSRMGGSGLIDSTVTPPVVTAHGAGADFDQQSGLVIRNGSTSYAIDLSLAVTVEDLLNSLNSSEAAVLAAVNENGTGVDVRSRLSGVDFAIGENGGTTATQLGLRTFTGATELADLNFGRGVADYQGQAEGIVHCSVASAGLNNDLLLRAVGVGSETNGTRIVVEDSGLGAGNEYIRYSVDPATQIATVTLGITPGATTANDMVALFQSGSNVNQKVRDLFTIGLDPADGSPNTGNGVVAVTPPGTWLTAETDFPADADFMITRNDGVSFTIDIHGARTIGDVLDLINDNPINSDPARGVPLEARLAVLGNGVELVDRSTGRSHLTVTRNPMSTAAIDLGLIPAGQDSNAATNVEAVAEASVASAAPNSDLLVRSIGDGTDANETRIVVADSGLGPGNEYIHYSLDPVTQIATVTLGITPGTTTANDMVALFQTGADVDPEIRELFAIGLDPADGSPNTGTGLVDETPPGTWFSAEPVAHGGIVSPAPDSDLLVRAAGAGTETNGTRIAVEDSGLGPGNEYLHYSVDPVTHIATLTLGITPGTTTANDMVALFQTGADVDPEIRELFAIGLDPADGSPNMGTGFVAVTPPGGEFTVSGGKPDVLTGTDVNSKETEGLFTALLRLRDALIRNDIWQIQHGMDMLDQSTIDMNFSRAELGARQQGLDVLQHRLDSEEIQLKQTMSEEYDTDLVAVISKLTARKVAYEASLKTTAEISRMSLLTYL